MPRELSIVVDANEHASNLCWEFPGHKIIVRPLLKFGCDYAPHGQVGLIGVERKSYGDYVRCIGKDWDRFQRQLAKLQKNLYHCVIVEGSLGDYIWRDSRVTTDSVITMTGHVASLGVPVLFAKNRRQAQLLCVRFFENAIRRSRE